jgi:general secretion pathway protein E
LVFSTLHTNDSFGALTRLVDMGIEPFLVSSSVIAVLAQRLMRVVCADCRQAYTPSDAELTRIGLGGVRLTKPIYKPVGCKACRNTGYRGRTAVTELMVVDDDVRALVMQKADGSMIRRACTAKGMKLLRQDGADRILAGQTTIEELLRVTQEEIA